MDIDVLIVGAGPTGLTLACELARRGVSFRLIDAAPGPRKGSRGKGLQPRTLELFERLGLTGQLLAEGWLAAPVQTTAPDGTVTRSGQVPPALLDRPDIPWPASVLLPQSRTEALLSERLRALGGAVEFGVSLTGLEQTEAGVVAHLEGQTVIARWLVGCDGGHSTVRKAAGIPFVGKTLEDVRMLLADLEVDGPTRDAWHMWSHPEGMTSLCPLPSTTLFSFQAALAPGQDPSLALTNLQALFTRRSGTAFRFHEPEWTSLWRANIRLAERYRQGHVLLAGDAAHTHSPAGGQGMNTGIQDAFNLGWKLAAVLDGAGEALLDSYEAERRPIAEHVLALSNARLEQMLEQRPLQRDASTLQLDLNYRGSPLVSDDRHDGFALRAGDRAPDATGLCTPLGERRLFELLRSERFTLLTLGGGEVLDASGQLARTYEATERTQVLIRPDGYIARISDRGDLRVDDDWVRLEVRVPQFTNTPGGTRTVGHAAAAPHLAGQTLGVQPHRRRTPWPRAPCPAGGRQVRLARDLLQTLCSLEMFSPSVATVQVGVLDLERSLSLQVMGRFDPTGGWTGSAFWKVMATEAGNVRFGLRREGEALRVEVQGPGAEGWLQAWLQQLPPADGYEGFAPSDARVRQLHARFPGLRFLRVPWLFELTCACVLQQRVRFEDALRDWRKLSEAFGVRDAQGLAFPDAARVARLQPFAFQALGLDPHRARALISVAKEQRFARFLRLDARPEAVQRRLLSLPGIGPWTTQMVLGFGLGEPDAVPLGDVHLPRMVGELFGERGVDDARMTALLEPFRGHRFRVVRLIYADTFQRGSPQ